MIYLFFFLHDHSGARTYANELLNYLSGVKEIGLYMVYFESKHFKEYNIVQNGNIMEIHLPSAKKINRTLEKYSDRCLDLLAPLLVGKKKLIFHLNVSNQVKLGSKGRERFGAKLIYTRHFLPDFFSYYGYEGNWLSEPETIGDVLEREMANEVDRIICVTRFAKEAICHYYKTPVQKLVVIHNGFSTLTNEFDDSNEPVESIKKRLGFSENEKIILFVGLLEPRKGVATLIHAFDMLLDSFPETRLVIVGDGDFKKALSQIKRCWSKISFTGKISYNELKSIYKIATVGAIPSVFEQCSYVALEMMKHGLPVVASSAPGLIELYNDGEDAVVVPLRKIDNNDLMTLILSDDEYYEALLTLLNNSFLRRKISKNTRSKWEKYYTVESMGNATNMQYNHFFA